jgi:hypothetical protein
VKVIIPAEFILQGSRQILCADFLVNSFNVFWFASEKRFCNFQSNWWVVVNGCVDFVPACIGATFKWLNAGLIPTSHFQVFETSQISGCCQVAALARAAR